MVTDRMGTTNHLSDASGNVLASTLETDAFGVETSRTDPSVGPPSRSGFAGGWGYEGEGGGLSLVGNRWYDADAGRFLTRDPARDGSNWWAYVENDPVNAVDPEGLDAWEVDAANFFGGWGGALTGGLSGALAQKINRALGYGEFEYGGAWFAAGEAVGIANGMLSGGVGGAARVATKGVVGRFIPRVAKAAILRYAERSASPQGISVAARAIEKHMGRLGSAWPRLFGSVAEKNAAAARLVQEVVTSKTSVWKKVYAKRAKKWVWEISDAKSGRGITVDMKGNFIGVRE